MTSTLQPTTAEYLVFTVTFPMARYHPEQWPPSPVRLMSALLAGCMTGGYRHMWSDLEPAFRWLESRTPPVVIAPTGERITQPYRIAVPNNDLDVAAAAWAKGQSYDAAKLKTMKTVQPLELPRDQPSVHYLWHLDGPQPAADWIERFRSMARCLHTLGWGVDVAFADARLMSKAAADTQLKGDRFVPAESGEFWETPVPGFLDDLIATYGKFVQRVTPDSVNPSVRPTCYGLQPYRKLGGSSNRSWAAFSLRQTGDQQKFQAIPWSQASLVHSWLRHASANALRGEREWPEDRIAAYIQGHNETNASDRISFLPMPTIGTPHTDGLIRRVAIIEPFGRDTGVLALLRRKLAGTILVDESGQERCLLSPIPVSGEADGVCGFYRPRTPRRVWESVTPVVLHGYNASRGKISLSKTNKLIIQAFELAGYPAGLIASVCFQPAPMWPNAGHAARVRVPAQLDNYPRYHIRVEFKTPVGGPVIAGIGRHCGIGVFASPSPETYASFRELVAIPPPDFGLAPMESTAAEP